MDWFRQIPIGQYVDGNSGWLRAIDPRIKFSWVLMFLLTPILADSVWRVALVIALLGITFISFLPVRIWWRSLSFLLILACFIGVLSMFLPTGDQVAGLDIRPSNELPDIVLEGAKWTVFNVGPFQVDRRSAELGLRTSTLIFTVVHSVNLMLLTTPPEDLVWSIRWFISPLAFLGIPIDRISFQLLLSLRFLPLVQEELQNLLRSVVSRSVNYKEIGFKASFGLLLSVGERLLANILLRAEQGADALLSKGGKILPMDYFQPKSFISWKSNGINVASSLLLFLVLILRGKYGA